MPQDLKSHVNNLIIVWQGSSWSVIAPDGHVLFRHWSKQQAYDWASETFDYASDEFLPYEWDNNVLQNEEKSKRNFSDSSKSTSSRQIKTMSHKSNKREETCFEIIILLVILVIFFAPVPIMALLCLGSVFFGFSFPSLNVGLLIEIAQRDTAISMLALMVFIVPSTLMRFAKHPNRWSGKLLRQPLTLLSGLLGLFGIVVGLIGIIISIININLDTMRVIIVTILWSLLCYFTYQTADDL